MNESVSGLNLNAPVRYRGVEIGRVQKIMLAPGNIEQVQLTLSIIRGTPIKTNTVAILQTHGLTGLTFVELSGGSRDAPKLEKQATANYPVIKTGPSLMTRLDTSLTAILSNLNHTSENINDVLDKDNRQAIRLMLADLQTLSHTLATRQASIDSSLLNAARLIDNSARMSDDLPVQIQRSTEALETMSTKIGLAADNTSTTLKRTDQFTSETLPEIHQLVIDLRELTRTLHRLSAEMEQNPSMLVHGMPVTPRGPGE
jgi:phospholipid/cholesterol/gamma-HCH transport system substrate-binding protein